MLGEQEATSSSGAAPEGLRGLAPAGAAGVERIESKLADAKKNGMTRRKIQYWVTPPQADAEFGRTWNRSWICIRNPTIRIVPSMDEQPVQLVKETRPPMAHERPRRVDYE